MTSPTTVFGTYDFDAGAAVEPPLTEAPEAIPAAQMIDASQNPEYANRVAALAEEKPREDVPLMTPAADNTVTLQMGVVHEGHVYTTAVVREMTGADEEAMSKSLMSGNITRFIDVVVNRGVESIGPLSGKALKRVLGELLVGDRDLLAMALRRATYGDELVLDNVVCQNCDEKMKVTYICRPESEQGDVPVRTVEDCPDLEDNSLRLFPVTLPSGAVAEVVLLDGDSQQRIFTPENENKNQGELNTLVLQECVKSINGRQVRNVGPVRDMSMRDRRHLMKFIVDNQPGPRYEEVVQECIECKEKFPLVISVLDLFRFA